MQVGQDGYLGSKVTETVTTIDSSGQTISLAGTNYKHIELVSVGIKAIYFRLDGTMPTAGANQNGDILYNGATGSQRFSSVSSPANIKAICNATETSTLLVRLYS